MTEVTAEGTRVNTDNTPPVKAVGPAEDLERFKQWLSFAKFLLGTFALGLITLLVNHQIQERELEMKEQEEMSHFLNEALTAEVGAYSGQSDR